MRFGQKACVVFVVVVGVVFGSVSSSTVSFPGQRNRAKRLTSPSTWPKLPCVTNLNSSGQSGPLQSPALRKSGGSDESQQNEHVTCPNTNGKSRAYVNDACITMLIFNPLHALFAAVPCEHVLQNEPRGGNNPTFRTNSKIMSHPNPSLGYLSLTIQNDLATKCGIIASQAHQAVALASPSHRWSSDQVDTKAQIHSSDLQEHKLWPAAMRRSQTRYPPPPP